MAVDKRVDGAWLVYVVGGLFFIVLTSYVAFGRVNC